MTSEEGDTPAEDEPSAEDEPAEDGPVGEPTEEEPAEDQPAEEPAEDGPAEDQPAEEPHSGPTRSLPLPLIALGLSALILLLVYLIARVLVEQGDQVPSPVLSPAPVANPVAEGFQPLSVVFLGPDRGFVSGSTPCSTCDGGRGGLIAATLDGGITWDIRYQGQQPILGLRHIGRTELVTATATTCRDPAFIGCELLPVTSVDLGTSWSRQPPPNHLWASPPPPPVPCLPDHPYAVSSSFPTPRTGWVLCAWKPTSATHQYKGLYRTRSGGRGPWYELPEFQPAGGGEINPSNMPEEGFAWGIDFLRDGTGWLWTVNAHASLSVTRDGGRMWHRIWNAPEPPGTRTTALSASLLPGGGGWLLTWDEASGTTLQRTLDGGNTWLMVQRWPLMDGVPLPVA